MLENKKFNGVHYSRYIASWHNVGEHYFEEEFLDWLKSLGMSEEEARDVREMAMMGKLELEIDAKRFLTLSKL